jgi:hypothetical protein
MSPERSLSRHDLLLVAIALPLLLASLVAALLPVGTVTALGAGSVPATGSMGYALFYNPPS